MVVVGGDNEHPGFSVVWGRCARRLFGEMAFRAVECVSWGWTEGIGDGEWDVRILTCFGEMSDARVLLLGDDVESGALLSWGFGWCCLLLAMLVVVSPFLMGEAVIDIFGRDM